MAMMMMMMMPMMMMSLICKCECEAMLRAACGEILVALCRATHDCKCDDDDNDGDDNADDDDGDDDDDDDDLEGSSKEESGVDESSCSNAPRTLILSFPQLSPNSLFPHPHRIMVSTRDTSICSIISIAINVKLFFVTITNSAFSL